MGLAAPPAVFYRYAPDRKTEQAQALLKDCRGYLHADAYAGFRNLYEPHPMTGEARLTEVACWAHARRKIYEVHAQTASPMAASLLTKIADLFAIEADIRGKSPEQRSAARREHAVPLLEQLKCAFDSMLGQISGKSALAQALRYSLSRWEALTRYTQDGRLDICNNAAERAIRPLAIGRKNWLFAGSDPGGQRAAIIYTLNRNGKNERHRSGSLSSRRHRPHRRSPGKADRRNPALEHHTVIAKSAAITVRLHMNQRQGVCFPTLLNALSIGMMDRIGYA